MAEIKELKTLEEFNQFKSESGFRVIKFSATWCGPCRSQEKVISGIDEIENVKFGEVDVDHLEALASFYNIMSIPVLIYFKDGYEIKRTVGLRSADEIIGMIKNNL